jgi:hypothetical protein
MWQILKAMLAAAAVRVVRDYQRISLDALKIRATRWYVKGVAGARLAFLGYLALIGCLLLALVGFVMLHVGVFLLLPVSLCAKAALLIVLGVLYFAVPLCLLRRAAAQETWMKLSRADDLVAKVTGKQQAPPAN